MQGTVTGHNAGVARRAQISEQPASNSKSRGRQRSEESKQAIFAAILDLLKEKAMRDISIDEIARKAGVGKATIYKWWPSKACVALDAFVGNLRRMVPVPDTGSAENDFREQLHALFAFYASPGGKLQAQFIAEGQSSPEFATLFRDRFLKSRREVVGVIFDRAVKRREISGNLNRELVLDLIYGPAMYRLMAQHGPLDSKTADQMIFALFNGLRIKPARMHRGLPQVSTKRRVANS